MKYLPLLCLALGLHNLALANLSDAFEWSSLDIPEAVVQDGQVGAYIDGTLLLAGGIEFDGEASSRIYALKRGAAGDFELVKEFSWDQPIGQCKSTYTADGLYLTGLGGNASREIYKISYYEGQITTDKIRPMPEDIQVIGLDYVDSLLCVFGLRLNEDENILLSLDTSNPEATWQKEASFPGPTITDAAVCGNYNMLHILGGTLADGLPTLKAYGWRKRPIDGSKKKGWFELSPLPHFLTNPIAYVTGQAHIGILGEPTEMDLNRSISFIYHSITDTWVTTDTLPRKFNPGKPVKMEDSYLFVGKGKNEVPVLRMKSTVGNLNIADYIVMFLYFLVLAAIGAYFSKKQKSARIFAVGGGHVVWWAAAISMFATGASAVSFMAFPSQVFRTNIVWFLPAIVFVPFYFISAYLLYPLLRQLNIVSTYEYLQQRFHPSLRMLASFQCIAFQTFGRISVVILLPALAISAVTGMDVWISILLMGIVTTVYTTFGGFEAVVWTDVLQGMLMICGISMMILFGISGMEGGFKQFIEVGQQYEKFNFYVGGWDITIALSSFLILRQLSESFAMTADQPMIQRVFSTPLDKMRRFSAMFCFFAILISALVHFMGLSIFGYFNANPEMLDPLMNNDEVVPLFVVQTLPAGISGLIIAALFAASMSSLSSSINSVSTLIAEDFYCRFVDDVSDRTKLLVMKSASLFIGTFGTATALFMATLDIQSMFKVWFEIIALIGGGFVGMYFLGMFTRRANSAGVVVGAVFSVIFLALIKAYTPVHWSLYQFLAIFACVFVGYLTSVILPSKERDLTGLTVFTLEK